MTNFIEDPVYYYNEQLRNYILQFAAVFAGLKVKVGKFNDREPSLIPVQVTYGAKDRVVAHIKSDHTQNKPLRLPALSVYLNGIELAPEKRKGIGTVRRQNYMPVGGVFPDDIETIEQMMPIPYNSQMELVIYTSNRDEHLQIIEQILTLFDPILQIQTSDEPFDWTKITTIELMGINFEENYPSGPDRRIIQTTLNFQVPIWLAAPSKIKSNFIKDIMLRIGMISQGTNKSEDIIAELDDLGYEYEKVVDFDDLDLQ